MFTGSGLDDKSKDELIVHTSNMSGIGKMTGEEEKKEHDGGTTSLARPEITHVGASMDPPAQDPPSSTTTSTTSAAATLAAATFDYFTVLPTQQSNEQQQPQSSPFLPLLPPKPEPSVAGSNALGTGTMVAPSTSPLLGRPAPQREPSTTTVTSVRSVDSNDTVTQDQVDTTTSSLNALSSPTSDNLPPRPDFPNQAYAALHNQVYPVRRTSPVLRQSTSQPAHILTFAPNLYQSGSRTAGNSPAATPSAGLYSPKAAAELKEGWSSPHTPGTYASPYLHPTHRQAPKETHVADVDVDPISGRKLINHYEIIDELGRGTHGKVKLGRDLETADTFVAIKIVERYSKRRRLGKLGNPEDKVKKEVAILKKARHPNIVALLEVIDDPSRKKVYIVLEWVERGTIHWRAKAPKEIAFLEAHRYNRERSGVQTGVTEAEDNAIQREVARRLHKHKQDEYRKFRRARKEQDPNRGIDHYGGGEFSDEDTLSRISTTTNESSLRSRHEEIINAAAALPPDGTATPTVEQPQIDLHPDALLSTEDLRAWAARMIDEDLNPELQYVPVMTLQNIRVAFRDTLLGLLYLHYQGIIHRDIKPPNLLHTTDHRVKISDFGVSYLGRPVHEGEPGEEVSESEVRDLDVEAKELAKTVGTAAFYAPELCITDHQDDPLPVTKAIDVWALGITLFCMIFARTPFVDSEYVVMRQIAEEDIYIPRRRLAPVGDKTRSRPSSRNRAYSPQIAEKRQEYDLAYEEIDDMLHDLLKRLLVKDPRQRATLEEIRQHPWLLADLQYQDKWIEETDTYCQSQGKKIEISNEDLNTAVVPLQFLERMRSGFKKIGDRLLGSTNRGRSTSSVNSGSGPGSQPPSAHSSSSTISQDARRHSLRSEEIFTVLKSQRESEHPLAQALVASPQDEPLGGHDYFRAATTHLGPFDDFGATLAQTISHDSATRPPLMGRSKTDFSTTGSVRTVKQSDIDRSSPPSSPALPATPRALDPVGSNFGALLGGSHRGPMKASREKSTTRSVGQRDSSTERSVAASDAHSEPSLAVSDAQAAGQVLHSIDTTQSSASEQDSPVSVRSRSTVPSGHRSILGGLSRHNSIGSVASTTTRKDSTAGITPRYQHESTEEDWRRGQEQYMRRRLQEATQQPRPASAFEERDCPPSPDDVRSRQSSDARRMSELDSSQPTSYGTSPTTLGAATLPTLVSSSSDFGSAVSISVSNPSMPSVISEASSVDRTDGPSLEEVESKHIVSSWDTITGPKKLMKDDFVDEGYNPDEDTALDSDQDATDSDSDSDGGIVMSRRKSAGRIALSSSPRNIGLSAALDAHGRKQRRGTGLSKSSKKSSRSGSNNTMKKVRTRDSLDERRRISIENNESNETK